MLSGIRIGKAKKKKKTQAKSPSSNAEETNHANNDSNKSAAERLKQALKSGKPLAQESSYMERVLDGPPSAVAPTTSTIVLDGPGTASAYRQKREEDMTVTELAAKEKLSGSNSMSWNEHMTRDILRVNKKRRRKANAEDSEDEQVERLVRHLPDYDAASSTKHREKEDQRQRRRQIDQYQKQEKITSLCSWWIQSASFSKDRLLGFGKHVSFSMAPPNASLVPGHHFYLVPFQHAPSMVDCSDNINIRDEIQKFRKSLEKLYARKGKGIVLCETVLPNRNNFWQTRLEVVPVPFSKLEDAPMYFKSSLVEQQAEEENGTHTKIYPILEGSGGHTADPSLPKPLASVIPKKFPYFFVDWGNRFGSNIRNREPTGYAQIIESSNFPKDFGLDVLAAMMEVDNVRFHKKQKFPKGFETEKIRDFAEEWKAFDWTQELEE